MQAIALSSTEYDENYIDTTNVTFTEPTLKTDKTAWKSHSDENIQFNKETVTSEIDKKSKIIFLDVQKHKKTREKELQWWIGKITDVKENYFKAVLEDLNGRIHFVEFDNDFVSQSKRDRLFIGSRFTYSVSVIDTGADSTKYQTKLAFYCRKRWLEKYDKSVQRVAEEIFPENLLNL